MRVGIYTFRITERPTGLANYTMSLTRSLALVAPDVEVTLLSPYSTDPAAWYDEFQVHHLGTSDSHPWMGLAYTPVALHRAAKQLSLDIIHAPANVAPFVGLRSRSAYIATIHDLAPLTLPREHRLAARLGYRAAIPTLRWTADAVLTVSSQAADDLARHTHLKRSRIFVTPNGVDLPTDLDLANWRRAGLAELGIPSGTRYLLSVGDIRPRKNLARTLEAFTMLRSEHPAVRFVLAGQEMHRSDEVAQLSSGLGESLIHLGYVDPETLHRLYSNAAGVAMASLAEGFGLPALEAMAHGVPPIVSNLPVLTDLVGSCGIVVDPYSVASIKEGMRGILGDPQAATNKGDSGRARAGEFSWRKTAEMTLDVYRSVVAKRQGLHAITS